MPPVVSNVVADPNPVLVNSGVTLCATIGSTEIDALAVIASEYRIDNGPFTQMTAAKGNFGSSTSVDVRATIPPFSSPGIHTILVRASDAAGGVGSGQKVLLAVYDPTAGSVAGGGVIETPAGSCRINPGLTAKANFSFTAKYENGGKTLIGQMLFMIGLARLRFEAISYDWLVVDNERAYGKGSGRLNGAGDFGFLFSAIDGQFNGRNEPDKLRIRIWDRSVGTGNNILYDNQMNDPDTADPANAIVAGRIEVQG